MEGVLVAGLLEGEKIAARCRELAISRRTGYKIFDRYKESGIPLSIVLLLRAIAVYSRVFAQQEKPGPISASRRRPRLRRRYRRALEWSLSAA